MPSVKDTNGKEWSFTVNVASLARVKENLDWDLLSVIGTSDGLSKLYSDPVHLTGVLFWLCKPAEIQIEQFREAWSGDCLEETYEAICKGLIDFFPRSRRQIVSDLIQGFRDVMTATQNLTLEKMPDLKAMAMEEAVKEILGKLSGAVPDSSESTPENTPSDNSSG